MRYRKPQTTGWLLCLFLVSCNFVSAFSAQRLVALRCSYGLCPTITHLGYATVSKALTSSYKLLNREFSPVHSISMVLAIALLLFESIFNSSESYMLRRTSFRFWEGFAIISRGAKRARTWWRLLVSYP